MNLHDDFIQQKKPYYYLISMSPEGTTRLCFVRPSALQAVCPHKLRAEITCKAQDLLLI